MRVEFGWTRGAWLLASVVVLATVRCGSSSSNDEYAGGADASTDGGGGQNDATIDQSPPDSCTDGIQNGGEIAVDCGGGCLCDTGQPCQDDINCKKSACVAGKCQPPNCADNIANGAESDVDCGGIACPKCADLKACGQGSDCASGVCTQTICQAPTCTDKAKNQDETDIDCGGATCPKCADGLACQLPADCSSQICQTGKCVSAQCIDKVENGDETDLDCGGKCGPCADGLHCKLAVDCQSKVCTGGVCQVPNCPDGVKNGNETDVDCGGSSCPKCADTNACTQDDDCMSGVCTGTICQAPTCKDTVANGAESDVDCGGALCPGCPNGKACKGAGDCVSGGCTAATCGPWSKRFGAAGDDLVNDVVTDATGNIIIVGSFNGSVDFGGPSPLVATNANKDAFVAKFSPTGQYLWAVRFVGPAADEAVGVALATNGDILVTGFSGTIDLGGGTHTVSGAKPDMFVGRLKASNGSEVWATVLGGTDSEQGWAIAGDKNGDVIVGGSTLSSTYSLGGTTFTNKGSIDACVVKLKGTDGSHLWSIGAGTLGNDVVYGVATDSSNNVLLTGRFNGGNPDISTQITFGTKSLQSLGWGDVMMVKLSPTGSELWATSVGSANDDYGLGLATNASDEVAFVGQRNGPIDLGGGTVSGFGSFDPYVVKLDSGGSFQWGVSIGGGTIDGATDVVFDGSSVYIGGVYLSSNLDFGGGVLPYNNGLATPFVWKVASATGALQSASGFSCTGDAAGFMTISPGTHSVIVAGYFAGTLDLGAGFMTSTNLKDIYLGSLGPLP